jgi:hypothetical protein
MFHGRFLRSGQFFAQNAAILRNALQTAFVRLTYEKDAAQHNENMRKISFLN